MYMILKDVIDEYSVDHTDDLYVDMYELLVQRPKYPYMAYFVMYSALAKPIITCI